MSLREKGRRRPGSQPARPFSVPSLPQNAAKVRGYSRTASAFTAETDCLLEQRRFELMVPPRTPGFRGRHMGPATAPGFGVAPS
jgi:hypothetical protein